MIGLQRDHLYDMVTLGININEYMELDKQLEAEGKNMNDHFRERDEAMKREIEDLKQYAYSLKQTIEEMRERGRNCGEAE